MVGCFVLRRFSLKQIKITENTKALILYAIILKFHAL